MHGAEALVDRLLTEYLLRREEGESPDAEEYLKRLPTDEQRREFRERLACLHWAEERMPATLRTHTVLADRYELLEELGSGGFGKVWRANDRQIDLSVAVKVFNLLATNQADLWRQHEQEMKALVRLQQPGVVGIRDVGDHDGTPYLVMDLVDGRSLADVLADLAKADAEPVGDDLRAAVDRPCRAGAEDLVVKSYDESVARIAVEMLRTLEATHDAGILHRDIKPANVMLEGGAHPVLLDFGMASLTDEASGFLSSRLVGTANYLAPEQIRDLQIGRSHLTDIYQAGLLLYEMLTLRPAFSPQGGQSLIPDRVLRGDYPKPCEVRAEIPEALEAICLRAIQHRPERRFESAKAFRVAVDTWLRTGTVPDDVLPRRKPSREMGPDDDDRFEVIETVLRTEFETVQRAHDRFLGREVVLKRAGPGLLSPFVRSRVRKEAQQLTRVKHPGVVGLFGVIESDGDLVLVMEPLRGAPLAEELDDGPLPVAEVCQLGTQLCDAVGALHHVGVVHCCLGPDTVWRTPEGAPVVTGFTFARDIEGSTMSTIGFDRTRPEAPTPAYIAPEQLAGRRPDARTDVYSLGCLLFRCLTGRDPEFGGKKPPDPRAENKLVSRALKRVVTNCLHAAPSRRYTTTVALAEALATCG